MKKHEYRVELTWTGNRGTGTSAYTAYGRDHEISGTGKPVLRGSSDPAFRGDATKYNPEELLVASLSSCHMLWFLHFCATAGVKVRAYQDHPLGTMEEEESGAGQFTGVTLKPQVELEDEGQRGMLPELHRKAHEHCFIARSVNFEVLINPNR